MGGCFLDHVGAARKLRPAEDVAAADDDRELDVAGGHAGGLASDPADLLEAEAALAGPAEALARELEHHAAEDRLVGRQGLSP